MSTMSMSSVRRLLNKSLSSKQNSKSQSFANENVSPVDPNIQVSQPQFPPLNPKKSAAPKKLVDFSRSDPVDETSVALDPPVKVLVRIRPKTVNEKLEDPKIKKVSEDSVAVGDRRFNFDSVLDSSSKQEDVFKLVGEPLIKDALAGYNASILSYGQTASGKTYTMWGPPSAMLEGQPGGCYQQGIVPRIFQMLFSEIEREKENSVEKHINYQCRCSFLEIYNGQIGDLLDPSQRNLQIKDDAKNGFYIENLTEEYVTSYDDVAHILIKGLSCRRLATTSTNSRSSRSHIVFTCVIESWCKEMSSNSFSSSKTSRISLVDLAAVERNKQVVDGGREFEKERKDVKSSLSHLGHLVNILADGTQPDDIMYRDSCLTHLLQQSLGGNAKLSLICTISPDIKNYGETLSTLRFGQRIRSIQNKPIVNEITEEDMDGLTDQIRQLKEELIRAKLKSSPTGSKQNLRESVNQLRMSLNRSLILPRIDNIIEEDHVNADENDVRELCNQLDRLNSSCEDNPRDFASEQGSCDSYFTSEHEANCLHEPEEVNSSRLPALFEEPAQSESPKFKNLQRKSIVCPSSLLGEKEKNNVLESSKFTSDVPRKSVKESASSLRSSKIFSGPTESLAASLKRGLEIIDSHQQNSSSLTKSSVAFSFEHLMLKPSPAADKVNASVSNLRPSEEGSSSPFICASCHQKMQNVPDEVDDDSLKTWISTTDKDGAKGHASQASSREQILENVCNEQATKIEELNRLVEQLKNKGEKGIMLYNSQGIEDKVCNDDAHNPEPEIIKETCEIEGNYNNLGKTSFDMGEKEELLMEIQILKRKLQSFTEATPLPNKSIDKLRSSLLSRSMQIRKSMSSSSHFNNVEELEKEKERWTEMESEWINLTDELRIDIESQRRHTERVGIELQQERKIKEELDDALYRAVLGHVRFVEQYTELQEKYNHLSESHRRVMETITDVKKAASKAGAKGNGARYVKAFAAELSVTRAEEKRERERLRRENNSLRIQLRETAEAVQTAGELLVRLREAEEAASLAETNLGDLQQENEKLRKQIEKMKNKHKMEMVTVKQYMVESKLPESALHPIHFDDEPMAEKVAPSSVFTEPDDDDQSWRAAFGATYHHHY